MRPVRITVEGFFAYRKRASVDLTDVSYFALEGPTGSGKSSLIDAMIFALYGRVPRLGGGTVAPAISAGAERARVSLDFEVHDVRYTATRLLTRTKGGGASTTEARLESGDQVVASGAALVTAAIVELLNLSFEDFTRTVVLPQGEFARFLTATPKERQELLRGLLGLEIYRTMATLARSREQSEKAKLESSTALLQGLDVPTKQDQDDAIARVDAVDALVDVVAAGDRRLKELDTEAAALEESATRIADGIKRLDTASLPERIDELAEAITAIETELSKSEHETAKVSSSKQTTMLRLESLPDVDSIDRFADLYRRKARLENELNAYDLAAQKTQLEDLEAQVATKGTELSIARDRYEAARIAHSAHDIASRLAAGDTCPVCGHTVRNLEISTDPVDIQDAKSGLEATEAELEKLRDRITKASAELAAAESAVKQKDAAVSEIKADLEGAPAVDRLGDMRAEVVSVAEDLIRLGEREKGLEEEAKQLRGRLSELAEQQRSLGRMLMQERERLADLKPPLAESEDVLIQWKEFASWTFAKSDELKMEQELLASKLGENRALAKRTRTELETELERQGIPLDVSLSVAVVRAQEQARQTVEAHRTATDQAKKLASTIATAKEAGEVASVLATHLRSDGFERWMMVGAISGLVAGANTILGQLSESNYSLHTDSEGSFDILDHRNADEVRPISTLSGGETFLVSLALALSLAETLAASGGSNLDAIILDEGFGTLDDESLDVVAAVLEGLSVSGLMVGIITHVRALASRAPTRFAVMKGPDGSSVEVVE